MIVKNTGKTASYVKKAIKDAAEYNLHLNQDRKDERLAYFDMQTQVGNLLLKGHIVKYIKNKIASDL